MATNSEIQTGLNDHLIASALGYPVAWPGINFDPPGSGYWLKVDFLPNAGAQPGYRVADSVYKQGVYQVAACGRPGAGAIGLGSVAQSILDAFPRGTVAADNVRVTRQPYQGPLISDEAYMMIPVTIEYAG